MELERFQSLSTFERKLWRQGVVHVAGIDEAGRGSLAGPLVAAACILYKKAFFAHLNDSKQVSAAMRERLYAQLSADPQVIFGVGMSDVDTINRINILQATLEAMQKAVQALSIKPQYLLIDGNQKPSTDIEAQMIVHGDERSISIAAASIIAKVTRDRLMVELDQQWPCYGFKQHKGYGTKEHIKALQQFGPCPIHRNFQPVLLSTKEHLVE